MPKNNQNIEQLLANFIEKDIALFKNYTQGLNEETLVELPVKIRSIKSRLDQLISTIQDLNTGHYQHQRSHIQKELNVQIQACQHKIMAIQEQAKKQLTELSRGAQLLGSYRIESQSTSNFLDSQG